MKRRNTRSGTGWSNVPALPSIDRYTPNYTYNRELRLDARAQLGGGDATAGTRAIGASGSIVAPILDFVAVADNSAYFMVYIPHDMDVNQPGTFSVVWVPGASWSTGNYVLKLDYLVIGETAAINAGTPTTLTLDVTPANAVTAREDTFTGNITVAHDNIIYCRFWRDVSEDNGDDGAEVLWWEWNYKSFREGDRMHPGTRPW